MSKSWEQILGGYATGTLTEEEKRQLFEAALDDQALFDTLADEEGLRALLANPEARQKILASLQASGAPQGIAETHSPHLRWYRQPSSLAWAGSMAAMGLALLFGWQMEAIWGPVVQEELQAEREITQEKDDVALRSQPSRVKVNKSPVPKAKNKIQREASEATSPPPPILNKKTPIMVKALKAPKLRKEPPVKILADQVPPPPAKKEMVSKPQEQTFADRMPQQDASSSMGARDVLSSQNGSQPLGEQGAMKGKRTPQQFGGMASDTERAVQESSSVEQRPQVSRGAAIAPSRGIRYRFIQVTSDGEQMPIDIDQLSGNWANLQLGITSTVPGYLYVMTEVKNGNWQWLKAETQDLSRSSDGAINVMPNEAVLFSFGPIPHDLGRPFISSVTVLLSTTPILDLGTWLGTDQPQDQIYQALDKEILVIDRNPNPQEPFRVHIPLG